MADNLDAANLATILSTEQIAAAFKEKKLQKELEEEKIQNDLQQLKLANVVVQQQPHWSNNKNTGTTALVAQQQQCSNNTGTRATLAEELEAAKAATETDGKLVSNPAYEEYYNTTPEQKATKSAKEALAAGVTTALVQNNKNTGTTALEAQRQQWYNNIGTRTTLAEELEAAKVAAKAAAEAATETDGEYASKPTYEYYNTTPEQNAAKATKEENWQLSESFATANASQEPGWTPTGTAPDEAEKERQRLFYQKLMNKKN